MKRIPFSRLLLVVALIPTLALALFAGRLTYESWSRYDNLARATSVLRVAVAAGQFGLQGMPGEGVAMREFFATGDRAKLDAARANADRLYRQLKDTAAATAMADQGIERFVGNIDRLMQQFQSFRSRVDSKTAQPAEITPALQPLSMNSYDLIGRAGAIAGDAELSRRIFALYSTLQFAEGAFMQRGFIQISLQSGQLPTGQLLIFGRGLTLQASFRKMFYDLAPAPTVAKFTAFYDANGKDLEQIQTFVAANAGKPAEPAMLARWDEINRGLSALVTQLGVDVMDIISTDAEAMRAAAWREMLIYAAIPLVVLILIVVVTTGVLRIVRSLLVGLSHTMDGMREGEYEIAVPSVERRDEIGVMARATESFRESLVRMRIMEAEQKEAEIRTAAERADAAAREAAQQRAAEEKAAAERKSTMNELARRFEAAVGKIVGTVSSASGQLETAAHRLTETAGTTQRLSGSVAAASEQASANVSSVAASTDELTSSVREISRQVHESNRIAGEAVQQAHKTDARISELSQAAGRIGDVVKLITAIAEQTNLLALNATIEAARAGEAGKGFAVVAQEVKALAGQTAKATDEIGTQIAGMQAATNESVAAIKEIGTTIGRISEITEAVAAAVEEQGAATSEIAVNVQQAARGTAEVAGNIAEVNRGASSTGSASSQVLSSAKELAHESETLKQEVAKFLETVRAA